MSKSFTRGFKRIVWAARFSGRGLRFALLQESAFQQECLLVLAAIPLSLWLGHTKVERALLLGSVLLLLVVELINSAIEATVDRFGDELHELSARAKDLGSAAVFMTILLAACTWGLILFT